jgi:predicted secreted acid phosphatase
MPYVNLANSYLRQFITGYGAFHQKRMMDIASYLPALVACARARAQISAIGQKIGASSEQIVVMSTIGESKVNACDSGLLANVPSATTDEGKVPAADKGKAPAATADADGTSAVVSRPLAAVLDIDEIILCNIQMNSYTAPATADTPAVDFHAADYFRGPDGKPWPRNEHRLNPLLPGAVELLSALADNNVKVFLITGRLESIRDETLENFRLVGLTRPAAPAAKGAAIVDESREFFSAADLAPGGSLIMCPDAEDPKVTGQSIQVFKEAQRARLSKTHHIILNVGDQASDMGEHGDTQLMLPHPFYYTP